jgi:hypothetical protein
MTRFKFVSQPLLFAMQMGVKITTLFVLKAFFVLAGLLVVSAAPTPQEIGIALVRMHELHATPTIEIDA